MSYTFKVSNDDGTTVEMTADYVRHGFESAAYGPHGDHLVLVLGSDVVGVFPKTSSVVRTSTATADEPTKLDEAIAAAVRRTDRKLSRA